MAWRLIEIGDDEATPTDLTDSELVGVSILLTQHCEQPRNDLNVYWRACNKLKPQAQAATDKASA